MLTSTMHAVHLATAHSTSLALHYCRLQQSIMCTRHTMHAAHQSPPSLSHAHSILAQSHASTSHNLIAAFLGIVPAHSTVAYDTTHSYHHHPMYVACYNMNTHTLLGKYMGCRHQVIKTYLLTRRALVLVARSWQTLSIWVQSPWQYTNNQLATIIDNYM